MSLAVFFQIALGAMLVNNIVVSRFLGFEAMLGSRKGPRAAAGMGVEITIVMTLATPAAWIVERIVLEPLGLGYLQVVMFVLVVSVTALLAELVAHRFRPALYESGDIHVTVVAANCAVLGAVLIAAGANPATGRAFRLAEATVFGLASGIGYSLILVLMAGIRMRLELADVPAPLRGVTIELVSAGLIALAFLGFSGLDFQG